MWSYNNLESSHHITPTQTLVRPRPALSHDILSQDLSPPMDTALQLKRSDCGPRANRTPKPTCITPSTPLSILARGPRRSSPGDRGAANARGPGGRSGRRVRTAEPGHVPAVQPGHAQLPECRESPCDDRGRWARAESTRASIHSPSWTEKDSAPHELALRLQQMTAAGLRQTVRVGGDATTRTDQCGRWRMSTELMS